MKFENNRLTPLKRDTRDNTKFGTYDIEARNWREFLMAGVFTGSRYFFHETVESLAQFLLRPAFDGWIWYAHFGGGYDHRFILDYILKAQAGYRVKIIENAGNIIALDVRKDKYSWKFWDSYQVLKGGLRDLTYTFDVDHKKLDADTSNMVDSEENRQYLMNDCMGLYEVIQKFYSLPLLDGVKHTMTTAGLAMRIFRQNYLDDHTLYKLTPEKEEFVRLGYYGGRNEIFKMKGENVREYDVNSMYVAAMRDPLPCGSKGTWVDKPNLEKRNTFYFTEAEVTCPSSLQIPVLPLRFRGKLLFPSGKFRGVFPSPELKLAKQMGYKISPIRSLMFPADTILKEYAENCWHIRQENPGKNPLNVTAKLLGNGLYGKFAQERDRTLLTSDLDFDEGCREGYTLVMPEYNLWRVPTVSESPAILPHISAAITSYSRCMLYEFLSMYPEKVCYSDTDSVFIEDAELPCSSELGDLKFEHHYNKFIALQPKFYYCEAADGSEKIRAKGFVFRDEKSPWKAADFEKALRTGDYSAFSQEQDSRLSKLNEAMKAKDLLRVVMRKRSMKTPYGKRIVLPDGQTRPIPAETLFDTELEFE